MPSANAAGALARQFAADSVALVVESDDDASVEEGELAQALGQGVEAEGGGLEAFRIGLERDLCATEIRRAGHLQLGRRDAALVALLVDLPVAPDLQIQRL